MRAAVAGAVSLPADGPDWEVMRPSRNRMWGHPELIAFIERLADEARQDGWPGLLVGDAGQPRGGPMSTGHASHQIGLDVDLWLKPMPPTPLSLVDRETLSAHSVLKSALGRRSHQVQRSGDPADPARGARPRGNAHLRAPRHQQVLCRVAGNDRAWLQDQALVGP